MKSILSLCLLIAISAESYGQGEKGYFNGPAARIRSLYAPSRDVAITVESSGSYTDPETDDSDPLAGFGEESAGAYIRLASPSDQEVVTSAKLQNGGVKGGYVSAPSEIEEVSAPVIQGVKGYGRPAYPTDTYIRSPALLVDSGVKGSSQVFRREESRISSDRLQSGVKGGIRAEPSGIRVVISEEPRPAIVRSAPLPPSSAPVRRTNYRNVRRDYINNWESRVNAPQEISYEVKPAERYIVDTHRSAGSPFRAVKGRVIRNRDCRPNTPTVLRSDSPVVQSYDSSDNYPTIVQQESQPLKRVERLRDSGVKTARVRQTTTTEKSLTTRVATTETPDREELEVELISVPTITRDTRSRGDQSSGVKGGYVAQPTEQRATQVSGVKGG